MEAFFLFFVDTKYRSLKLIWSYYVLQMSALEAFQNISSAWRPGKSVIEVENGQVCWVSDGWNDLMWLVPTSHCGNATRESIGKLRMRKGPYEACCCCWPYTELIPVTYSLLGGGGGFVLNYAFSKKHGFPIQEMGGFLNSITWVTCRVGRTLGNQLPH